MQVLCLASIGIMGTTKIKKIRLFTSSENIV